MRNTKELNERKEIIFLKREREREKDKKDNLFINTRFCFYISFLF